MRHSRASKNLKCANTMSSCYSKIYETMTQSWSKFCRLWFTDVSWAQCLRWLKPKWTWRHFFLPSVTTVKSCASGFQGTKNCICSNQNFVTATVRIFFKKQGLEFISIKSVRSGSVKAGLNSMLNNEKETFTAWWFSWLHHILVFFSSSSVYVRTIQIDRYDFTAYEAGPQLHYILAKSFF